MSNSGWSAMCAIISQRPRIQRCLPLLLREHPLPTASDWSSFPAIRIARFSKPWNIIVNCCWWMANFFGHSFAHVNTVAFSRCAPLRPMREWCYYFVGKNVSSQGLTGVSNLCICSNIVVMQYRRQSCSIIVLEVSSSIVRMQLSSTCETLETAVAEVCVIDREV